MASFDIILQTCGSLHPDGEPDRFISEYTGVIRCVRESDGKVFKVGKVQAFRIHVTLAREAGECLFDVCDCHSQDLLEVHTALFDPESDELKEEVRDQFDVFDLDVLVLDYILLAPRWRGLKLGLLAARKLVDLLGGSCGLVVSHVAPLNHEAADFRRVPAAWIPRHDSKEEEGEARRKLRRYFRRMGFRRIKGTRYHGLSMTQVTPTLSDLIRPAR